MLMGKNAEAAEAEKVWVARACSRMAVGMKEMDDEPDERNCR